jgi:hypothetical protein
MNTDKDPMVSDAKRLTYFMSIGQQIYKHGGYNINDPQSRFHVCELLNQPRDTDIISWPHTPEYTAQLMMLAFELGYVELTNGLWSTTLAGKLSTQTAWDYGQRTEPTAKELDAAREAALATYMAKRGLIRRR